MAIQIITKKKITKFNTESPNFKPPVPKMVEELDGNLMETEETDIYGEKIHTYQPDNGNLQMSEFMTGVMNKIDGLTTMKPDIVGKNRAIEVDIKREIAISKADINGVTSEEIKGKVCVFCNSNDISKINSLKVQMHKMNLDNTYSYFKNGGVEVSACRSCSSSLNNNKMIANILAFIITAGITALSSGIFIVIDLFLGFLMTKGIFWGVKFEMYIKKLEKHPSISKLKLDNYKYGLP